MASITIEEARTRLDELIHSLSPGQELEITEHNRPVAKLVATRVEPPKRVPRLGTQRGSVLSMEHFDDPLEEFEEYM
jgi:prevent-host-death family protein